MGLGAVPVHGRRPAHGGPCTVSENEKNLGASDNSLRIWINARTTDTHEDINQRYLKDWAHVADILCFGRT